MSDESRIVQLIPAPPGLRARLQILDPEAARYSDLVEVRPAPVVALALAIWDGPDPWPEPVVLARGQLMLGTDWVDEHRTSEHKGLGMRCYVECEDG